MCGVVCPRRGGLGQRPGFAYGYAVAGPALRKRVRQGSGTVTVTATSAGGNSTRAANLPLSIITYRRRPTGSRGDGGRG